MLFIKTRGKKSVSKLNDYVAFTRTYLVEIGQNSEKDKSTGGVRSREHPYRERSTRLL